MAIAGSTLEVLNIRIIDGAPRIANKTRMAAHLVVKDPAKALAELRKRGHVALWLGDNNWRELQKLFEQEKTNNG